MLKNFIIILISFVIMNSCDKNNKMLKEDINNKDNIVYSLIENDISEEDIIDNRAEGEIATELILAYEKSRFSGMDIPVTYLAKVNFGIPDGDNWLAETRGETLALYLIKDKVILNRYSLGWNDNKQQYSNFDIMRDIPGTHINNGTASYGDFNADGIDEIFQYTFSGMGDFISIFGYNAEKDDLVTYCDIPFRIIDAENGPAPIEFMTYKSIDGFKVYYAETVVAGGPNEIPEIPLDNNKWFFYAWDEGKKKYIRIEEVKDGE